MRRDTGEVEAGELLWEPPADARPTSRMGRFLDRVDEQLVERAYTIADHIMSQPRTTRRLTTQIVRRPWKRRIVNDLDGGFGIQMFGHVAKKRSIHKRDHISNVVDYVREGRRNSFDTDA